MWSCGPTDGNALFTMEYFAMFAYMHISCIYFTNVHIFCINTEHISFHFLTLSSIFASFRLTTVWPEFFSKRSIMSSKVIMETCISIMMRTMMTMMTMRTMITTLNIRHQRWWLRKNLDLGMKRSTTRNMLSPHFSHKWVINTIRLVRIVGGMVVQITKIRIERELY